MTYSEVINYLYSQLPMYQHEGKSAYKHDLKRTEELDKYFNHPHTKFKTVHIAGTNGKGSVSHMIASVLQEAGLKTGLYTSPHLFDFRERIKIDGQMIPELEVINFVEQHSDIIEKVKPSFFEMTVSMAFNYFAEQGVDIAIIETGLGGRLDSTNIISPIVSVITNIGLDHTAFLGNTIEDIAKEKAGIIKKMTPVIVGELSDKTTPVFKDKAKKESAPICYSPRRFFVKEIDETPDYQTLSVKNIQSGTTYNVELDLKGKYQKKNIIPVFGALQILVPMYNIPKHCITTGLSKVITNTGLRGRWEIVNTKPKTICDTAHNKEGLTEVMKQLTNELHNRLHIVFGSVNDKDAKELVSLIPKDAICYFTQASIARAMEYQMLVDAGNKIGLNCSGYNDIQTAYNSALQNALEDDIIFIGGSTFVVGDFLSLLNK